MQYIIFITLSVPLSETKSDQMHIMDQQIVFSARFIPLKRQSQLQQTTNFATFLPIFDKNKVWQGG